MTADLTFASTRSPGLLYVIATPIGNLDDISLRAKSILGEVHWIACEDTRHSQVLLNHLGIKASLVAYHEHNAKTRTQELIDRLKQGEQGALISDAGTPLISDPGYQLIAAAHQAKIRVSPIPGPCAVIAALSAAGLATDNFLFVGFLSAKGSARRARLQALCDFAHTMVFLEAPHRIQEFIQDALTIFGLHRQACVARELTKKFEQLSYDSLQNLALQLTDGMIPSKGEFVIVIQGQTQIVMDDKPLQDLLQILLKAVSLKQAVTLATQLTNFPKNKIYALAMQLKTD